MRKVLGIHENKARTLYLLYEALTELHVAQPIMSSLPSAHIYAASRRYQFVTDLIEFFCIVDYRSTFLF